MVTETSSSTAALAQRLVDATNRHDLAALADCFGEGFVNETPAHPSRSFVGSDVVRRNWSQIFGAVPDMEARAVRQVVDGPTAWIEWEMRGTRVDGSPHLMRGVTIFGVEEKRFAWVRFYMELVEEGGAGIDEAVRRHLGR